MHLHIFLKMPIWLLFQYQRQPNLWLPKVGFKKYIIFFKVFFAFQLDLSDVGLEEAAVLLFTEAADPDYASRWVLLTRRLLSLLPPQEDQLWGFLHRPLQADPQLLSWT